MRHTYRWTPEEDAQLTALIHEQLTYVGIGDRMGRSAHAIESRAAKLGLKKFKVHGRTWTAAELAILRANKGAAPSSIVHLLPGRDRKAISLRMIREFGRVRDMPKEQRAVISQDDRSRSPYGVPFKTTSGIVAFRRTADAVSVAFTPCIHGSPGSSTRRSTTSQ